MLETASVKSCLEGWREPVVHLANVLTWEKDWYAAVIAGVLTFKFLFVWYWDPTLLTLVAITGLWITVLDYLGPKIMAQIFKPEGWTGEKEKRFEQVCEEIVCASRGVSGAVAFCRDAKVKKPVLHFLGTVAALFVLAWIGNRVSNFFLLYLATLGVAMLPGLHKKGILKKVTAKIGEAVKGGSKDGLKKSE